jgi:GxxExxY protein
MERENQLTEKIIGCAIEVHRVLGPGLLESTYEACLEHELRANGLMVIRQASLNVEYKGLVIEETYRLDLLVENRVIVEIKAADKILPIHRAQLLTYLKHSHLRVGLLINFNVALLKDGITRLAN